MTCAALQSPAEQLPYLVELRDANDPLLAQSIAWAAEEHLRACANGSGPCRIAGWLQPHVPNGGATLARQIGALLRRATRPAAVTICAWPIAACWHCCTVLNRLRSIGLGS
ncbi:hypothetical protein D9M68_856050 [compost metagenome]